VVVVVVVVGGWGGGGTSPKLSTFACANNKTVESLGVWKERRGIGKHAPKLERGGG
jgi:hypothetical protein